MAYDKGSTVLIEVTFRRQTPFGSLDYFDPTVPKITVTDPGGTAKVDAQSLTKSAVGKYYYNVQTLTTWMPGEYISTITGTDGAYDEVDVEPGIFELE